MVATESDHATAKGYCMKKSKNYMADVQTETKITSEDIVVRRRGFDLDAFERVSLEGKISFTPLPKENFIAEALSRAGGDQDKLYSLFNSAMRRDAVLTQKSSLQPPDTLPNWVPSAKVVLGFLNNFRAMAPYSKFPDTKAGRKDQTAAITAFLKSQPALIESIKMLALAASGSDEDEDGGEDNE